MQKDVARRVDRRSFHDRRGAVSLFIFGLFVFLGYRAIEVSGVDPVQAGVNVIDDFSSATVNIVDILPEENSIFTPEVEHWDAQIDSWAEKYDLDPNLIKTVMQIESCGAPDVVSKSGAMGLFQVMPFHFETNENGFDIETNALRGLNYLHAGLEKASGNVGLALAGYNGGHSQITKDSSLWSDQTKRYWYWGTGIYADAQSGVAKSSRLQEWLNAGGASLCEIARVQQEQ